MSKFTALVSRLLHGAEHHRAYVYRVAATVGALLVGGGQLTAGRESALLTLLGAVLGLGGSGLAAANTSTRKPGSVHATNGGSVDVTIDGEAIARAIKQRNRRKGLGSADI